MSERQKQKDFLKALICSEDTHELRDLEARINKAEHDEKCVRCAMALVGLMELFAASGFCYSAVLLPEFFQNSTPFLVKFFCALALGSGICLAVFVGYWFWYRHLSNRLFDECRRIVLAAWGLKFKPGNKFITDLTAETQDKPLYRIVTPHAEVETHEMTFRKVS